MLDELQEPDRWPPPPSREAKWHYEDRSLHSQFKVRLEDWSTLWKLEGDRRKAFRDARNHPNSTCKTVFTVGRKRTPDLLSSTTRARNSLNFNVDSMMACRGVLKRAFDASTRSSRWILGHFKAHNMSTGYGAARNLLQINGAFFCMPEEPAVLILDGEYISRDIAIEIQERKRQSSCYRGYGCCTKYLSITTCIMLLLSKLLEIISKSLIYFGSEDSGTTPRLTSSMSLSSMLLLKWIMYLMKSAQRFHTPLEMTLLTSSWGSLCRFTRLVFKLFLGHYRDTSATSLDDVGTTNYKPLRIDLKRGAEMVKSKPYGIALVMNEALGRHSTRCIQASKLIPGSFLCTALVFLVCIRRSKWLQKVKKSHQNFERKFLMEPVLSIL